MAYFSIAMGQGIVADVPLEVDTTNLLSCTFIAGAGAGKAGAFHYPAKTLKEVENDLNQWLQALQPTQVVFVFATPQASFGFKSSTETDAYSDTPLADRKDLKTWLALHLPNVKPAEAVASAAAMTATAGGFKAGRMVDLGGTFDESRKVAVNSWKAGAYDTTHGRFTLFGYDHDNPPAPPQKAAAATGPKCCTIL